MVAYQEKIIENTERIAALIAETDAEHSSFDDWYLRRMEAEEEIVRRKAENTRLLSEKLFPVLDRLYEADQDTIDGLLAFADRLMDWNTNLDNGIYVVIHDALLSLARHDRDRDRIIMELYKLGMGHYYLNRALQGMDKRVAARFFFRNEMLFTEAGSYLKFFAEIESEETKGYIIRSLANIAICAVDRKKRVAVTSRILKIIRDPYYRELAPGLPWDRFLRASNQQMSANRSMLSKGGLSPSELSEILEACLAVFEPEKDQENPNIRWLWPYYEMEYSCGFADLATTCSRLEKLIRLQPYDRYDMSGLYGNVQLPVYYGELLRTNPSLLEDPEKRQFLSEAYEKMLKTILSCPTENQDVFFRYEITLVISGYHETAGTRSFREVSGILMKRMFPREYVEWRITGELMRSIAARILASEPDFFDDIPFVKAIQNPDAKEERILQYAADCGLYHDFGLLKMNLARTMSTRNLFDEEDQIMRVHTRSGQEDLLKNPSTEKFADIAFGHHAWYNGQGGYPEDYIRTRSPYRMMTDIAAVAVFLQEGGFTDLEEALAEIYAEEGRRFSPMVTRYLGDEKLKKELSEILFGSREAFFREVYDSYTL